MEQNLSSLLLFSDQTQKLIVTNGVSSQLIYEGSPCDAFPCWNGGTCVGENGHKRMGGRHNRSNRKAYTCKCRAQFEGEHCERRRSAGNSTNADWCSTERQTCPQGMLCVVSGSAADRQCLSIGETFPASPTEFLFPLLPLLLIFYGLFLFVTFLLFCWAGNSSGFFLLIRKRNKRCKWKQMEQRRSEYEPILEEEEGMGGPIESENVGICIEMEQFRRKWDHRWFADNERPAKANGHLHGQTLFSVDGTRQKAMIFDSDLPSIPKIVHI